MKPFKPPAAAATRALIALCVAVQLVVFVGGDALSEQAALVAGLIPARIGGLVAGVPGALPVPLTFISALFVHGGWAHLLLNLVFLAWVGKYVEWVVGRWRFVALYLLSGIAGGLLHYVVNPGSIAPVVGASGAIAGVFGAYAVLFARSKLTDRAILGVRVPAALLAAAWYAATWTGLQLLIALAFNTGGSGIAIWAHIGGFITGLCFAQPFRRPLDFNPFD